MRHLHRPPSHEAANAKKIIRPTSNQCGGIFPIGQHTLIFSRSLVEASRQRSSDKRLGVGVKVTTRRKNTSPHPVEATSTAGDREWRVPLGALLAVSQR
ncbi:histidine kinase [Anopheles sinensis]|uniref:Histidine kinase n=1 Tax=Anopheles sinensis TaxID=74873 RepID=A0A084VHH0_ANOSI|nr:histidine kinase [Anopheles sinensis]